MKILLFIILSLLILLFLFLNLYFPFAFPKYISDNKTLISNLRNYYSILASLSSMAISGVGAFLGYYYFKDKKNHEDSTNKKTRLRNRFEFILSELDKYDNNVEKLFFKKFSNYKELKQIRHKIRRSFENIQSMLEKTMIF